MWFLLVGVFFGFSSLVGRDFVEWVAIPIGIIGILLYYAFKILFFKDREYRWWHYVLGALVLQSIPAYILGFILFILILPGLSIGF